MINSSMVFFFFCLFVCLFLQNFPSGQVWSSWVGGGVTHNWQQVEAWVSELSFAKIRLDESFLSEEVGALQVVWRATMNLFPLNVGQKHLWGKYWGDPLCLNGYSINMNYGHMGRVESCGSNRNIRIKDEIQYFIGA